MSWASRCRLQAMGRSARVDRTRWTLGGETVDQVAEVGEEHRVGQVVEIVEDDDDFGELGQLCVECLQQGRSEAPPCRETSEARSAKSGSMAAESPKQTLGEADGSSSSAPTSIQTNPVPGWVAAH